MMDKVIRLEAINARAVEIENLFEEGESTVMGITELPAWMTSHLNMLCRLPDGPPNNVIEGVGRKISPTIYWLYKPTKEQDDE
tara:strand:+ start:3532 stop:3780 length:249 start_codon:yes stop_codon:yes gene_type:complete